MLDKHRIRVVSQQREQHFIPKGVSHKHKVPRTPNNAVISFYEDMFNNDHRSQRKDMCLMSSI